MASGRLGSGLLSAGVNTLLFVTGAAVQTFNVRIANPTASPISVSIAIGSGASPAAGDWITGGATGGFVVPANGIFDDTGLVSSPGEKIWVYSNSSLATARAHGLS